MRTVSTEELKRMMKDQQPFELINVQPREQFQEDHIPSSTNVPLSDSDFVEQVEQIAGGKGEPLVVYCASADCDSSLKAADMLDTAGFTKVMRYVGGTKAWHEAEHQVGV